MIKQFLLTIFVTLCLTSYSQIKSDGVIVNDAFISYINITIKMPVYVKYKLYKGGGKCERSNKWINDSKYDLIRDSSYAASGYEKGHLANAEDFAYDCHLDSLTFNNYNRLPQTKALNRGIWKKREAEIRALSQKDSLLIICGGYWETNSQTKIKGMLIPSRCWKVVYSLTTEQVVMAYLYTNTENPSEISMSVSNLEALLGYSISMPPREKKKKVKKSKK